MKNLHIIAFTTPQNPSIQIGAIFDERQMTNIDIGQGCSVLKTFVLDGTKLYDQLKPINPPAKEEIPQIIEPKTSEQISLANMITGTKYLADKYGTKLEQKHITNLIARIYEAYPTTSR